MSLSIQDELQFRMFQVQSVSYTSRSLRDYTQSVTTLSHIVEGEVAISVGDSTWVGRSGDVMVHRPHVPFSIEANRSGLHRIVNLDIRVMGHLDFFHFYPLDRVVTLRESDRDAYSQTYRQLEDVWNRSDSVLRNIRAISLTLELVSLLIGSSSGLHLASPLEPPDPANRFVPVLAHMERHLADKLTNRDLAELVHLNPTYFQRAFRAVYGMSPMEMLRRMRLRRAKQLLEDPRHTLESIAQTCGFYDAAHFSHLFQQEQRLTPGEYRKRIVSTKTSVFHT